MQEKAMAQKRIRLDKYLSNMGIGTRSEVKKHIKNGLVQVNNIPMTDPGALIDSQAKVVFAGQEVNYQEFSYLMMNKPQGVISATEDQYQHTVLGLLEQRWQKVGLFPAGRLDKDTEGLLLLTNDGKLAHNMLSPKKHVAKTYEVKVLGHLGEKDVAAFEKGILLEEDLLTLPGNLEIEFAGEISLAKVTISEGKFHQIKRMFHALGKEVIFLKRLSMGDLTLDPSLKPGEYRELTSQEMNILEKYK